jgi:hypothetical protein
MPLVVFWIRVEIAVCAGAVVLPVPQFDDMGHSSPVGEAVQGVEDAQAASPPASGALPTAQPLERE